MRCSGRGRSGWWNEDTWPLLVAPEWLEIENLAPQTLGRCIMM